MEEKRLQLVTFEQAKKLKELGFDWEVENSYHGDNGGFIYLSGRYNYNEIDSCYSAPRIHAALKWIMFERKHNCPSDAIALQEELLTFIET
jgi:hypothetical protein